MIGERVSPQSEVITAILSEDSPGCGVPRGVCRVREARAEVPWWV